MATTLASSPARYQRGEAAIAVFGTWMISGLFLDGWAHNVNKPETFFSPWHFILYSGFGAAVVWFMWDGRRQSRSGVDVVLDPGDRATTVGLVLFIIGAVGDGVWHEIFGIEVDLEALLSPTHLLLLIGGFMMVTTPVRGAWADPAVQAPTLRQFAPQVLSLTLASALVLFFTQYLSAFEGVAGGRGAADHIRELREVEGLASVLATNLILMYAVAYTLRRLRPPPGTFTILFTGTALAMSGLTAFELIELVIPFLVAGVVADALAPRVHVRILFGVVPVVLWSLFFAVAELSYGVVWTTELWAGAIVLASVSALLLGALAGGSVVGVVQGAAGRDGAHRRDSAESGYTG